MKWPFWVSNRAYVALQDKLLREQDNHLQSLLQAKETVELLNHAMDLLEQLRKVEVETMEIKSYNRFLASLRCPN